MNEFGIEDDKLKVIYPKNSEGVDGILICYHPDNNLPGWGVEYYSVKSEDREKMVREFYKDAINNLHGHIKRMRSLKNQNAST